MSAGREGYERAMRLVRRRLGIRTAKWADRVMVACVAGAYITWGIVLLSRRDLIFMQYIVVPAVAFIVLSLARALINRPRPYEVLGFAPLLGKGKNGKSFPSRHVFSGTVIGTVLLWTCIPLAALCLALSVLVAVLRVACGVHWPSDVIAGEVLGLAFGAVGMAMI